MSGAADPEALRNALSLLVVDPQDAAFIARCILGEGPAHHRAASWSLIVLAAEIASRLGCSPASEDDQPADAVRIPLRLPPHRLREDDAFPLEMPVEPLRAIVGRERDVEALADALVDGPAHHALANAALVGIFNRILEQISGASGDER